MHELRIPTIRQRKRLREHALVEAAHAVETFRPVQEWDLQPRAFYIEALEVVVVCLVERVPVMHMAYRRVWGEAQFVLVERVIGGGTDDVVCKSEMELLHQVCNIHLG